MSDEQPVRPRRRPTPMLFQAEAAECGLACLAMAAGAYGHDLDLLAMRRRFRVSLRGVTLKDLVAFSRRLGLTARALRLEPAGLSRLTLPAILHVDMNHFVVLTAVNGGRVTIHDPGAGVVRLSPQQVSARFTGIALELTPGPDFKPARERRTVSFRRLVGEVPGAAGAVGKALALSVALQVFVLAAPLYVQLVIDRGVAQADLGVLGTLAVGFGLLALVRGGVGWLRARVLLALGAFLNARMVSNLVSHMLRLPHVWFETRHISGLLSRIASLQPLRDLVTSGLVGVLVDGAMALATLTIAFLIAPALAGVVLAGFAVLAAVKVWQVRAVFDREQEYIEAFARAEGEFIETVRGISSVKIFRKEDEREATWRNRHIESVNRQYEAESVRATALVIEETVRALVLVAVVWLAARQAVAGTMSLGLLMAFVTYQQVFSESAAKLLDFAARFKLLDVHLQRLSDVVLSEPERPAHDPGAIQPVIEGRVTVDKVSFRYGEMEDPVLTDVSMEVGAGEFVAITGRSGGGKTTLLKLILGLLEPGSGRVLYDGVTLDRLGVDSVRDQIGVVLQDDILLSGSLAENISFFDATPDLLRIAECARLAAVHEEIMAFPMNYNTLVGDMGASLSGGQKQRVLLARALYRAPRILFMDEGTSSLDAENERQVNANLRALNMTRIVIAHRAETIGAADRILDLTPQGLSERKRGAGLKGGR